MNPLIQHRQVLCSGQLLSITAAPMADLARVASSDISMLDLYLLRQHAQMGQLSEMEDWIDRQRMRRGLCEWSQVLLDEVESASVEFDFQAVVEATDRVLMLSWHSTVQHP
jgi:hypothetical protein